MTSALLVIDFQNGLIATDPPPGDAANVTARINALTSQAREAGVPVVFILHEDEELVRDTHAWQLLDTLEMEPDDHLIDKRTCDSFLGTELEPLLKRLGVNQLVVCGYATEFCVDATVRSAVAHGYPVTIVADAHTTHDKPHADAASIRRHHNVTLANIDSYGVPIVAIPADQIDFRALAGTSV
ncbi:cysteine hydrolase family protein [Paraburkholderia phosphatilytica]|uniref:cysteine hydrolase family protein n=1 Tax=Paraburkholderia phosphatilytica TaxID=2282883 RepID=UPI000E4F36A9|nr:cysteine hydrolase family protein [Paraburkholderia phosphatilytica]